MIESFKDTVIKSHPTGSRYICNPAPQDTDEDTIILVNGYYDYDNLLLVEGWERGGSFDPRKGNLESDFHSYRKGEDNYIVTEDPKFFERFVVATEAAKALNLLNKEDRIKLFRAIHDAPYGFEGLVRVNNDPADPRAIIDIEAASRPAIVFNPFDRPPAWALRALPDGVLEQNALNRLLAARQGI